MDAIVRGISMLAYPGILMPIGYGLSGWWGLISMMTGSALQEDIVSTVQILVRKGQDILDMKAGIRTDCP